MNITVFAKVILLIAALFSSTASLASPHKQFPAAIVTDCLSADALGALDGDLSELFLEPLSNFWLNTLSLSEPTLISVVFPLAQLGRPYSIRAPPHH